LASIREVYDFDAREGVIVNKKFGQRSFVLGVREWTSLVDKLYGLFGSGSETILFDIGKSYGSSTLGAESEIIEPNQKLTIDLLTRGAAIAGWGKFLVTQKSSDNYTIKAQRCVFCSGSSESDHKQVGCYFLKGVISGFAEILFPPYNTVEETYCGKDYCEFVVKLT
jgi:predicted hydrocarbon binding protein